MKVLVQVTNELLLSFGHTGECALATRYLDLLGSNQWKNVKLAYLCLENSYKKNQWNISPPLSYEINFTYETFFMLSDFEFASGKFPRSHLSLPHFVSN